MTWTPTPGGALLVTPRVADPGGWRVQLADSRFTYHDIKVNDVVLVLCEGRLINEWNTVKYCRCVVGDGSICEVSEYFLVNYCVPID